MTSVPAWIPLLAVLIGALASGGIQAIQREVDRRREKSAILNAITSEVAVICELVRFRGYLPILSASIRAMEAEAGKIVTPIADIKADYFSVFDALSSSLGKVEASQARAIVRFYAICKAAVDSLNPEGEARQIKDAAILLEHHKQLHRMVSEALALGDDIVQFAGASPARHLL